MFLTDDSEFIERENVADVAEVAPGRLMVAFLDGEQDMTDGEIFGATGRWKMWHDRAGTVEQFWADSPLTMPAGFTRFRFRVGDDWLRLDRGGRIRRLKRPDL